MPLQTKGHKGKECTSGVCIKVLGFLVWVGFFFPCLCSAINREAFK